MTKRHCATMEMTVMLTFGIRRAVLTSPSLNRFNRTGEGAEKNSFTVNDNQKHGAVSVR